MKPMFLYFWENLSKNSTAFFTKLNNRIFRYSMIFFKRYQTPIIVVNQQTKIFNGLYLPRAKMVYTGEIDVSESFDIGPLEHFIIESTKWKIEFRCLLYEHTLFHVGFQSNWMIPTIYLWINENISLKLGQMMLYEGIW